MRQLGGAVAKRGTRTGQSFLFVASLLRFLSAIVEGQTGARNEWKLARRCRELDKTLGAPLLVIRPLALRTTWPRPGILTFLFYFVHSGISLKFDFVLFSISVPRWLSVSAISFYSCPASSVVSNQSGRRWCRPAGVLSRKTRLPVSEARNTKETNKEKPWKQ